MTKSTKNNAPKNSKPSKVTVPEGLGQLATFCKSIKNNATKVHDFFMDLRDAEKIEESLRFMRKCGGLARSLAGHEAQFLVALFGFKPSSGNRKATCKNFYDDETIAKFKGMDYARAFKVLKESDLKDYTPSPVRKAKKQEADARADALKIIGGWDEALIVFISLNKDKMEKVLESAKKPKDAPKAEAPKNA